MATSKTTKSAKKRTQPKWIAERRLERGDAVGGIAIVRIGSPEWPPGAEEWRCPYIIEGLGDDSVQFGRSIDSMAALQNALIGIRCKLEQSGVPLRWEGFDEDLTGFPKAIPWIYGLAFYQRMEKMIAAEEQALFKANRERQERREARRQARKTSKKP